jgi:hypothetical protein
MTPIQLDLDWKKSLLLDLKVQPSALFIIPTEPEEVPKEVGEDGEEVEAKEPEEVLDLEWHCKSGLNTNIQLVKEEFEKARGLKPVKVLITGPPCAGKSFFGQQLGEHYNIPHIHMEKMLDDLCTWNQEKEDNHVKIEQEREKRVAEIEKQREIEVEKKALLARQKVEKAREEEANGSQPEENAS